MTRDSLSREKVIPDLAEVFRQHGFEGTTLSLITKKTGLGKGSLYNFFPGGKEEMAEAVLRHIHDWFQSQIFDPLEATNSPRDDVNAMLKNVSKYFESGQRICIVGAFALGESRDPFRDSIHGFFETWRASMVKALRRGGLSKSHADELAMESLVTIQGALVLARATDDEAVFRSRIQALNRRIRAAFDG